MSDIEFLAVDAQEIETALVAKFEEVTNETLALGDQRRMFLSGFQYPLVMLANATNEAAKANLLRFATAETLDALGEFYGTSRLQPSVALATIKFQLSGAQSAAVTIPSGTRVTPDGELFFAITNNLVFSPGEISKEAKAQATAAGAEYNGFLPGQINKIVDGQFFLSDCANTTVSEGGADLEEDESYRNRIRLSPFTLSAAGTAPAYEYYAKSANAAVGDVKAVSPAPNEVRIAVIKKGGVIPSFDDEILSIVYEAVNAPSVRALCDLITVVPAIGVETSIDFKYYISTVNSQKVAEIQKTVEKAVEEYSAWQVGELGRDVNPDELRKLLLNAGAARVVLTKPDYTELKADELAQISSVNVEYAGLIE